MAVPERTRAPREEEECGETGNPGPRPIHPKRIHIVGGPGSGKTRLSLEVSALTGAPVFHLDEVARVGGGVGPLRDVDERTRMVRSVVAMDRWITEGVHLGWTEELLETADVIVWLDFLTWPSATRRVAGRFAAGAIREMRRRPIKERFTRFGDYGRQLRALAAAIRESHHYYEDVASPEVTAEHAKQLAESRAHTRLLLERHGDRLAHCRTAEDVARFLDTLA